MVLPIIATIILAVAGVLLGVGIIGMIAPAIPLLFGVAFLAILGYWQKDSPLYTGKSYQITIGGVLSLFSLGFLTLYLVGINLPTFTASILQPTPVGAVLLEQAGGFQADISVVLIVAVVLAIGAFVLNKKRKGGK